MVVIPLSHFYCLKCLCKSAYLIHFYQNSIGNSFFYTPAEYFRICNKYIVSHNLNFHPQFFRHYLPAVPVILCQPVFYRKNRIFLNYILIIIYQFIRCYLLPLKIIFTIFIQRRCSSIKSDGYILPWFISCLFYCFYYQLYRLFIFA